MRVLIPSRTRVRRPVSVTTALTSSESIRNDYRTFEILTNGRSGGKPSGRHTDIERNRTFKNDLTEIKSSYIVIKKNFYCCFTCFLKVFIVSFLRKRYDKLKVIFENREFLILAGRIYLIIMVNIQYSSK